MPECSRCTLYPMFPREWSTDRSKWVHATTSGVVLCDDQSGPAMRQPWMDVRDAYEATWQAVDHPKGGTHWVLQDSHVIEMACREVIELRDGVARLRRALGGES